MSCRMRKSFCHSMEKTSRSMVRRKSKVHNIIMYYATVYVKNYNCIKICSYALKDIWKDIKSINYTGFGGVWGMETERTFHSIVFEFWNIWIYCLFKKLKFKKRSWLRTSVTYKSQFLVKELKLLPCVPNQWCVLCGFYFNWFSILHVRHGTLHSSQFLLPSLNNSLHVNETYLILEGIWIWHFCLLKSPSLTLKLSAICLCVSGFPVINWW